jgi:hypothetical protein
MPSPAGQLPAAAVEHMSTTAQSHLPDHLREQVAETGVYSTEGFYGAGPGWYHFGTSGDQLFLGHPGEPDYFVFDFAVTAAGGAARQGFDTVTQFERGLDGVIALNTFALLAPGESFNVAAEGLGRMGWLDDGVAYTLTRLSFDGPVAVETEIAGLGLLGFAELV